MTRSFESTGPDVKLRGTPNHIAEKYMSLARDAHSSGDPVLAENYMQHAEHYNRIIMSFREQQMSQGGADPFANGMGRPASMNDGMDGDEFGDEDGDDFGGMGGGQMGPGDMPAPAPQQSGQPRSFEQPQRYDNRQHQQRRDQHRQHNSPRHDRGEGRNDGRFDRQDRPDRGERQDFRGDRNDRNDRNDRGDRNGNVEPRGFREDRPPPQQPSAAEAAPEAAPAPRRRERFPNGPGAEAAPGPAVPPHSQQPEFLRRPVRRPRAEPEEGAAPRQPASEDQE